MKDFPGEIVYTELSAVRNAIIHSDRVEVSKRALLQGHEDVQFREWEANQKKIAVIDKDGSQHKVASFYRTLREEVMRETELEVMSGETKKIRDYFLKKGLRDFTSLRKHIEGFDLS